MRVDSANSFAVSVVDDVPLRLEVSGLLDAESARLLDGLIDAVREDAAAPVILDLTGMSTLDDAGRRVLEDVLARLTGSLEVRGLPV